MVGVLLAISLGGLVGFVGRKSTKLAKVADTICSWGVLLLLFGMGLGLGANPTLMQNLPTLGLHALLLAVGSTFGAFLLCLVMKRVLR